MECNIIIRHLSYYYFRWGGSQSILLSGSMNPGYIEPIPLPSTIYGFLSYIYYLKKRSIPKDEIKIKQGPLFYSKGNEKEAICIHAYPSKLICKIAKNNTYEMKIINVTDFIYRYGIALDRERKLTKLNKDGKGLIYMSKGFLMNSIAEKIIDEPAVKYGILVGIDAPNEFIDFIKNGLTVPFGSDSSPAKIELFNGKIDSKGNKNYLVTPMLLKSIDEIDKIKPEEVFDKYHENKVRPLIRYISLGYEFGKGLKEMSLALMPGIILPEETREYWGNKANYGWGLTIKMPTLNNL